MITPIGRHVLQLRNDPEWMAAVFGAMGVSPNAAQWPIVDAFRAGVRTLAIGGGERSGKSMIAAACAALDMGPESEDFGVCPPRRYWIVGPDYRQCRAEFLYIHDALKALGALRRVSMPQSEASPWLLETVWNVILETRSSSRESKLATFTVYGAILAEAGQQSRVVLDKLLGRTSETRGWVALSGTLEGAAAWYDDILDEWQGLENKYSAVSFRLPTWTNTAIYPGGWNDPEIVRLRRLSDYEYFMERYGAKRIRVKGLVIPEFEYSIHARSLKADPTVPVELAIDPGSHCYAVLFVQRFGDVVHVLDAVYEHNTIAQIVIPKVKRHPLFALVLRNTSFHGVIDHAGSQHQANLSQVELWRDAGVRLYHKYWMLEDTITAVRNHLRVDMETGDTQVYFNSDTMHTGIIAETRRAKYPLSEFSLWRWPEEALQAGDRPTPIDRNNDAIKALGYYLLKTYGIVGKGRKTDVKPKHLRGWTQRVQRTTMRARITGANASMYLKSDRS